MPGLDTPVRAACAYRRLPELAAQLLGAGLPVVATVLGLLLVAGVSVRVASALSALPLGAFPIGIAVARTRRPPVECAASPPAAL